ncbi:host specificity protein J, partial [Shigella sonnei]|nr:host specificity protein J [Shigella sonnei]
LVVIHRNHRCETVLPEHGTGRRTGGFGAVRQPAGEP